MQFSPAEPLGELSAQPAEEERHDRVELAVIGLGCVGLPLVREAASGGLRVVGLDRDPRVVAGLRRLPCRRRAGRGRPPDAGGGIQGVHGRRLSRPGADRGDLRADLMAAVRDHDLTVLLQDHSAYDLPLLADEARLPFDTRGRIFQPGVEVL